MQGIQARLDLTASQKEAVDVLAVLFQQSAHRAYSLIKRKKLALEELRKHLVSEGLWVELQVQSLVLQVQQWLSGDMEMAKYLLEKSRLREASLRSVVVDLSKKLKNFDDNPLTHAPGNKKTTTQEAKKAKLKEALFHKTRKLASTSEKIVALEQEVKSGGGSRVFGGKKLSRQRHQLELPDSPFETVDHWRATWERKREGSITLVGSGATQCGNQAAQIQLSDELGGESCLVLRLSEPQAQARLENLAREQDVAVEKLKGKLTCKRISIPLRLPEKLYQSLLLAQKEHRPITVSLTKKLTPKGKRDEDRAKRQFSRPPGRKTSSKKINAATPTSTTGKSSTEFEEAYYMHASFETIAPTLVSSRHQGALGIDVKANGFAWALVKPDGNVAKDEQGNTLCGEFLMPVLRNSLGQVIELTSNQVKHWLRETMKSLVALAKQHRVAVAIEDLDFSKKKAALGDKPAGYSRMLSTLRTSGFETAVRSRCRKEGVSLCKVAPAYTSVAGAFKYAAKHGFDFDEAAAFVIGRASVLGEDPNGHLGSVPTHNKTTGKKLTPKFVRGLQEKRDKKVVRHVERVCASRPLPEHLQRKVFGQGEEILPQGGALVSWRRVRKALGMRNQWRQALGLAVPGRSSLRTPGGKPPKVSRRQARLGLSSDKEKIEGILVAPTGRNLFSVLGSLDQQIN